jgi:hypothetical protein
MSTAIGLQSNATFWELKFFFLWRPPSDFFPHNLDGSKEVDNGVTPFVSFLFAVVVLLGIRATYGVPPFSIWLSDSCGFEKRSWLETRTLVVSK